MIQVPLLSQAQSMTDMLRTVTAPILSLARIWMADDGSSEPGLFQTSDPVSPSSLTFRVIFSG